MDHIRRKCFISYHHADQDEVSAFVKKYDHNQNIFIARGLGQEMSEDIINSTNTDYVMSRIRQLYLKDSTVTLVMLGKCTWARRYVDWEIQSSLRQGGNTIPNGILGIKLPSYTRSQTKNFPDRFNKNLKKSDNQEDCYARHMVYPSSETSLINAIEAAHQRRSTHRKWIVNPREKMSYNRNC